MSRRPIGGTTGWSIPWRTRRSSPSWTPHWATGSPIPINDTALPLLACTAILAALRAQPGRTVREILRPPLFVPGTREVEDVLAQLTDHLNTEGIEIIGHHELLIPLWHAAVTAELAASETLTWATRGSRACSGACA